MVMTCVTFNDLVRLNKQEKVAVKYTTMLRESVSMEFGKKFLNNFEIVQQLLGMCKLLVLVQCPYILNT